MKEELEEKPVFRLVLSVEADSFLQSIPEKAREKVRYNIRRIQKGEQNKELEFKKCKALLMEALEDHHTLSREEIDKLWWNLLPDTLSDKQKKAKVGNMLTKMRGEGDIVNTTVGNSSIWSLLKIEK